MSQGSVAILRRADAILQVAEPRENNVIKERERGVLPYVGPAAFLEIGFFRIIRTCGVDRSLTAFDPGAVEGFQLTNEEQVGDLLNGNQRVDSPEDQKSDQRS